MMFQSLVFHFLVSSSLFFTSFVHAAVTVTKDAYLVKGLEDIEPAFHSFDGIMYAGMVPTTLLSSLRHSVDDADGKLMFWLFAPNKPTNPDTIVVWMNGGPGCSSLAGSLFEHGPVTIPLHPAGWYGTDNDPKSLFPNEYTWTNATMMLYVEQPHGTGFTYGPDPRDEIDVGHDFYVFLQNLYTIFADDKLIDKQLYIFGESYAGMYVPSVAHFIHQQNKKLHQESKSKTKSTLQLVNLAGIGIGNGWIDGLIQGPSVVDFLWYHGMIDKYTADELKQNWENCLDGYPMKRPFHSFTTPDDCGMADAGLEAAGDGAVEWGTPNEYDISTFDKYWTIASDDGAIHNFFNNPSVQDALHVGLHRSWLQCSGSRHLLEHDRPLTMLDYIATLLDEAGIRVLVYNGDRDLLGNHPGSERALNAMQWSGAAGWSDVNRFDRGLWIDSPKSVGGFMKSYKNLYLLSVYNSGHMVPYNRPIAALDLINRFLGNRSFIDNPLPKFKARYYEKNATSFEEEADMVAREYDHTIFWNMSFLAAGTLIGLFLSRHGKSLTRRHSGYEMVR